MNNNEFSNNREYLINQIKRLQQNIQVLRNNIWEEHMDRWGSLDEEEYQIRKESFDEHTNYLKFDE